jgi:hypothetical protein
MVTLIWLQISGSLLFINSFDFLFTLVNLSDSAFTLWGGGEIENLSQEILSTLSNPLTDVNHLINASCTFL